MVCQEQCSVFCPMHYVPLNPNNAWKITQTYVLPAEHPFLKYKIPLSS